MLWLLRASVGPCRPIGATLLKVHPLTLAIAIVVLDLVAITIALLADAKRPELVLLVLNVFVLLVLYFVHASGGIRFRDDD